MDNFYSKTSEYLKKIGTITENIHPEISKYFLSLSYVNEDKITNGQSMLLLKFWYIKKNTEIVFPTQTELPAIMASFAELSKDNLLVVIGAIDCTHIPIQCPDHNMSQIFVNQKSFYSINCQVICDSNMMIRNIVARWPGSTHDSQIFHNSSIKHRLQQGYSNEYLIGDSGYPCLPYLMTPFIHPQTTGERRYNLAHSSAKNIIEIVWCLEKGILLYQNLLAHKIEKFT